MHISKMYSNIKCSQTLICLYPAILFPSFCKESQKIIIFPQNNFVGIPLTLHGRPSSRSSQRSNSAGPLSCAFTRRPSSGGSRGPLVPASRAGAARAAAILLISCHLQATKDNNKHRRTLSDVAEGSSDGLGRRSMISFCLCRSFFLSVSFSF